MDRLILAEATHPLASFWVQPMGGTSKIEDEGRERWVYGLFKPMYWLSLSFIFLPLCCGYSSCRVAPHYGSGSPWSMITLILPASPVPASLGPVVVRAFHLY